jgi:hypothetical protein
MIFVVILFLFLFLIFIFHFQIDEDRAGKQIDRKLVNNILALYLEISDKTGKNDAKYFAEKIIKENATLSCDDEVSNWMAAISLIDNTPKVIN